MSLARSNERARGRSRILCRLRRRALDTARVASRRSSGPVRCADRGLPKVALEPRSAQAIAGARASLARAALAPRATVARPYRAFDTDLLQELMCESWHAACDGQDNAIGANPDEVDAMRYPGWVLANMLLVTVAAHAQPMSLLEVKAEMQAQADAVAAEVGGGGTGTGAGAADSGQVEAGKPSLRYVWKRDNGDVLAGRHFDLALDTPAFPNVRIGTGDGVCFGYNTLVVRWLKKIVLPALDQGIRRILHGDGVAAVPDVTIANGVNVLGPIDASNIDIHRLFRYSSDAETTDRLARAAGHLQQVDAPVAYGRELLAGAFGYDISNPTMRHNPLAYSWGRVGPRQTAFTGEVRNDVGARSRELAMIDVQLASGGHSLVVYRVEEGFAVPVGSADGEKPAVRMMIFDPNIPEYCRTKRPYLMYFPDEERYAFDPAYTAVYAGTTKPLQDDGTYYTGYLKHRTVHSDKAEQFIEERSSDRSTFVKAKDPVSFNKESDIY